MAASEVVDGDYFAVGRLVTISGTVTRDVYAFAGQVLIDGQVNGDGDVLVGAGRVSISGRVGQNVRVAAGQVTLSGYIGRNVTVVGGSVELTRGASVKGSLVAAGGNVHIAAPIGKIARIAAGSLIVFEPERPGPRRGGGSAHAHVEGGGPRRRALREPPRGLGGQWGRLSRTVPRELLGPRPHRLVAVDTLVILMGVAALPEIVRRLMAAGRDPETPAAIIHQGTTPAAEVVTDRLKNIAHRAAHLPQKPAHAPALVGDGDLVEASAGPCGWRFLLVAARPLSEPIAGHGPFGMSTRAEIAQTRPDLRSDSFISGDLLDE